MNILQRLRSKGFLLGVARGCGISLLLVLVAVVCPLLHLNLATSSLLLLIVIVLESRWGNLASSLLVSIVGTLALAYIVPPAYSFRIYDPFDALALTTFFIVSLVISRPVSRLLRMPEEAMASVDRNLMEPEARGFAWNRREPRDDFNQRMALTCVHLEELQQTVSNSEAAARMQLRQQISDLATDIQALAHHLHSAKPEYLGIVAATKGLSRERSRVVGNSG